MDERESLKAENACLKAEQTKLLERCEDLQQEAESTKLWADGLYGELLTLRGKVAAYQHCIAALTGTKTPQELCPDCTRSFDEFMRS